MGERVVGIGGIFFKARDPERLRAWYRDHLPGSMRFRRRCAAVSCSGSRAPRNRTRARRVEETARLAARNVRANQWRPSS